MFKKLILRLTHHLWWGEIRRILNFAFSTGAISANQADGLGKAFSAYQSNHLVGRPAKDPGFGPHAYPWCDYSKDHKAAAFQGVWQLNSVFRQASEATPERLTAFIEEAKEQVATWEQRLATMVLVGGDSFAAGGEPADAEFNAEKQLKVYPPPNG